VSYSCSYASTLCYLAASSRTAWATARCRLPSTGPSRCSSC